MILPDARSAPGTRLAGAVLLLAAIGLGLFSRLAATEDGADAGSEWKGYRVILVDASLPEASILARLSSAGFDKVLSESTEPVLVSDWSGLKTISLAEAEKRMLPGDPRLDFYIQRLSQWFQAREGGLVCRVLYLKTGSNTDAPVDQALAEFKGRYFLPGSGGRSPSWIKAMTFAIAVVLMFGSCAATSLIRRGSSTVGRLILEMPGTLALDRLAFRLTIALPWVLFASRGAFSSAIATLWCLACTEAGDSLELPLEEIRHGRGARKVFIISEPARLAAYRYFYRCLRCAFSISFLSRAGCLLLIGQFAIHFRIRSSHFESGIPPSLHSTAAWRSAVSFSP